MREHRGEIGDFATTLVVSPFARADTAKIRPPCGVAKLSERACKRLRDLVVERAAEERMRMRDERNATRFALRRVHCAFDASCGSCYEFAPRRLARVR